MTRRTVLEHALALPKEERLALLNELWDSIEAESDATLSDDLKRELDQRIAADDADTSPGEEWNALKAKLLRGEL
ncbi:MAG: addiction module protein [Tepidisphaeraceae bacterium]